MVDGTPIHTVVAGNVGTVYEGDNGFTARQQFYVYVSKSKRGDGRAAGEPVVWLKHDEIHKEYQPKKDENDE